MKRNTTARLQSADSQTKRFGIEMLTPTMIILIIMTAYPLIFTLIYSFTDYNYLNSPDDIYVSPSQIKLFGLKVGDTVVFSKYGGTEIKYQGEEYTIMRQEDILAVIE